MHAHLINYAFYSLSLNTIDNSLGNWRYTSLIIIYCINKRGFFSRHFYPRCFSLSPSIFPFFSSPFLWQALPTIYPSSKAPLSLFFLFFTLPAGFKLSNFYRLRQTSSLSSIPLFYMCLLRTKGNFQNYISNTLFKFQKINIEIIFLTFKTCWILHEEMKCITAVATSKESGSLVAFSVKPRPASLYH